ncbi:hypothetical protein DHEL01_v209729 [Diaporthe helianthi]|uniref:Uncharacterized protein n=1 Tax=Diaporthe helianthi TaxID=158607 RepID=A0A2P5HNP2_DIAHE|nr:hypothetical protein DHEL01_v209729 [Diaporthe helianthi]
MGLQDEVELTAKRPLFPGPSMSATRLIYTPASIDYGGLEEHRTTLTQPNRRSSLQNPDAEVSSAIQSKVAAAIAIAEAGHDDAKQHSVGARIADGQMGF